MGTRKKTSKRVNRKKNLNLKKVKFNVANKLKKQTRSKTISRKEDNKVTLKNKTYLSNINIHTDNNNRFPIVAIGASAGGLEAIKLLFSKLPKIGMAYIIITHLDPDHHSILPDLIKKQTNLLVKVIKNNMRVEQDNVYVIPPHKNVGIENGILTLLEQTEPHYKNQPINFFFCALAEDQGENAIGIILSGSGRDGTIGLQRIKEQGGLIIAQDPLTADFNSMPTSAINTSLVDYVLKPEAIPARLIKYIRYGGIKEGKISPELQQIFTLLRSRTGHDFSHYKLNTICRRIEKQMFSSNLKTLPEYIRFLRLNPGEIDKLFKDLLIGVTRFFRDSKAFDALKQKMLTVLKDKPTDYCVRVWVPGCSTGDEAYSIAIILRECLVKLDKHLNIQIFATDIDLNALEMARNGVYPLTIAADIKKERLSQFFIHDKDQYRVKKEIRTLVVFGEQNIIKDPPFTKLDLICCRNLLIYLSSTLQKKVLQLFHYSLKPKGLVFLGSSESTSGFTEYFRLITKKWKIFERKDIVSSTHSILNFSPFSGIQDQAIPVIEQGSIDAKKNFIFEINKYIVANFVSPCIVTNKNGDILYTNGNVEPFIHQSKKDTLLNIYDHASTEIKIAVIPSIHRVETRKDEIVYKNFNIKYGKKKLRINLHVIPISREQYLSDLILILFEHVGPSEPNIHHNRSRLTKKNEQLEVVVQELRYTKENLQATIEELEAGNEELQSTNEELQSTNEEIETSKEELQSLNEELMIVNTELQNTIDQLTSVNDDMNNLFNSTEIAAFFLDTNMRIKRFTPKAQEFIHLIQSDIGRSISHFSTTIKYDKLVEDAELVLKTLTQQNIEVESVDHRWYHIRILPYRTLANMIDGVVITLADVTKFKEYEDKLMQLNSMLQNSLTYTENIVNTVREPLLVIDLDLKIISANLSFYKTFSLTESETLGKYIYELEISPFDKDKLRELLAKVITKSRALDNFKINLNLPNSKNQAFILNARKIHNPILKSDMILLAMERR